MAFAASKGLKGGRGDTRFPLTAVRLLHEIFNVGGVLTISASYFYGAAKVSTPPEHRVPDFSRRPPEGGD